MNPAVHTTAGLSTGTNPVPLFYHEDMALTVMLEDDQGPVDRCRCCQGRCYQQKFGLRWRH